MDHFEYRNGVLHAEAVAVPAIAAEYGTPLYVYSRATLERHWHAFDDAFAELPHLVCYAVKANSNLAVLNVLARLDSGFDIVSIGELERVLQAGGEAKRVVFSGVGKQAAEIERALAVGVRCINIESPAELERVIEVARAAATTAPISLRINPDVDPHTHPYISTGLRENKFGIPAGEALAIYRRAAAAPELEVVGIDCHIGSQVTSVEPYIEALTTLVTLAETLRGEGIELRHINIGGGLGIRYSDADEAPEPQAWAEAVARLASQLSYEIHLEPGRAIMGNAGIMLTRVEYLKSNGVKEFAVVDAAMNDLLRPSLYSAWQEIIPVVPRDREPATFDVVGPVCESGDFLGKDRPLALDSGDLLAVRTTGAYGFVMSSNYNSRPRAAEVMVDGEHVYLVRERETLSDLVRGETIPEFSALSHE